LKTITTVVCVSLLLILLQTLSAQTLTPDQVLKNMEQGNAKYPTLQADIERRAAKPLFNDPGDPYFGKIWIVRTANGTRRIKIDFSKPQKETILIEKNSFLHYYPVTKQGETKSLSAEGQAEGECVFLGLCQSAAVIQQHYDPKVIGQETIGNVKTTVLELKSKDIKRSRGISTIRLWLDSSKWIPVQTRIIQENGNYTEAKYSNVSTAKFSDSVFEIKLPKDASINKLK
jgi:outer membrane lipoprotein-sorting protein